MYGEKLKKIRKEYHLKQKELEEITGFGQSSISGYEKAAYPELEYIKKLCDYVKIPLYKFFISDNDMEEICKISPAMIRIDEALKTIKNDEARSELLEMILQQVLYYSKHLQDQK